MTALMLYKKRPAWLAGLFILTLLMVPEGKAQVSAAQFANERLWLKLLQYDESGRSEIDNDSFFFSPQGRTDPLAELTATRAAFVSDPGSICQFPARHMAMQRAGLVAPFDYQNCTDLQAWLRTDSVESITLVFADGYLKNPASFHGHLFLRIDSPRTGSGQLLDTSLNFGATVPDSDDPVTYILKGLFGGYRARYSAQPYYRHNLSYGEFELRNLWDYELAFNADQSQLLAAHLWELSRTDYQYFFTSKNCAYYVARAIEVVTQANLVHHQEWTVLPTDIIQRLHHSPENLVRRIEVNQSAQSQLQSYFQELSAPEQNFVRSWIEQPSQRQALITDYSEQERKRALITLSSYYSFLERQESDTSQIKHDKAEVLRALLQLAPGNPFVMAIDAEPPHQGQPANLARIGYRYFDFDSASEAAWTFTFRPSFYDRLQPATGKLEHSALSMGEVELSYNKDLELERLWLLNIEALNVSYSGLPGDGGLSWMIRAGAERHRLRDYNAKLSSFVTAGFGRAVEFGDITPYGLIQGRIHTKELSADEHYVTLSLRTGFDFAWRGFQGFCEVEQPLQAGASWNKQRLIKRCATSLYSNPRSDLRFQATAQHGAAFELAYSAYF